MMQTDRERKDHVRTQFETLFGAEPQIWSQAPGRVDLMGSHTDYNQGFVLTQAIDRNTWIAARPRTDRRVAIRSLNLDGEGDFSLDDIRYDEGVKWTNYVRGVAATMVEASYELGGFDGLVHSTIPFGSGLSSSAALEVSVATLFSALGSLAIDPVEMALLCQRAENEFVGMNCGILDQYTSVLGVEGGVLLLDCRNLTSEPRLLSEGIQVMICDTRASRELTGSAYAERRTQCEEGVRLLSKHYPDIQALRDVSVAQFARYESELPAEIARRCRFVIEENQRVLALAEAIAGGDRLEIGALMTHSYHGARDLYEVVSAEMEWMMGAMASGPGVIGARQAGAGFGGCMVAIVTEGEIEAFREHVLARYLSDSGIEAQVYPVRAAAGAGVLAF